VASSTAVAGKASIKWDGNLLSVAGSFTVSPLAQMREGLVGLGGVAGYKETPRIPFMECEVFTLPDFSLLTVGAIRQATIVAELANGRVYTLVDAWLAGEPDISAGDGTTTLRFEGKECIEQ
jgi:hypothetical protein